MDTAVLEGKKDLNVRNINIEGIMGPRDVKIAVHRINVKLLITDTQAFDDAVAAFDYALEPRPETVKIQIRVG
jgi:D-xylulose reductase